MTDDSFQAGFSLVELLVVIGIMGVLLTVTMKKANTTMYKTLGPSNIHDRRQHSTAQVTRVLGKA
jgi:prepilin-type N-terminal cleavage/methylation domain-containing protein